MSKCLACGLEHSGPGLQCYQCQRIERGIGVPEAAKGCVESPRSATDARTLPETAVPQRNAAQGAPDVFVAWCREQGVAEPVAEYRFDKKRRWRFDYCWPAHKVALEIEGGAWIQGRHTRGKGYIADLEKYSEAAARGWRLIRVTPDQLCTAQTLDWVRRALGVEEAA